MDDMQKAGSEFASGGVHGGDVLANPVSKEVPIFIDRLSVVWKEM